MFKPSLWLILFLLGLATLSATAMPPHPEVLTRFIDEGRFQEYINMRISALAKGVDTPFEFNRLLIRRDGCDEVELRAVCILVDFNDKPADTARYSVAHFQSMLFSVNEYRTGSMRDWYLENSYGNVHILGEVYGWYRMPQSYDYYCNGQHGFGEYPQNAQGLTRDALLAADRDINFRDFDNDDNGIVEALFIVHSGPGAEATGSRNDIWSHAWFVPENVRCDQMQFARYAMEPENGNIGVFGHELGHSLFGLPDLYDGTYESAGVGMWSMMAAGSWGGGGNSPVHFDAWCKSRIGFANPFPIIENQRNIRIQPIENEPDILLVWRLNDWGRQYFLVENRQRIGFDQSIPASGMLIWHIDENMEDNTHPWRPDSGGALHYMVALEQADGQYHLERNINNGDSGDPWPGSTHNDIFNDDTVPDARDYFRRETDIQISNIEQENDRSISCDISVTPGVSPEELNLFLLERIPETHLFPHPDVRGDSVLTDEVTLITQLLYSLGVEIDGRGRELPDNIFTYNVILYIEPWRDEDNPDTGLSAAEQNLFMTFLDLGKKIIMIGPDIAYNIYDDHLLWSYLNAEFIADGTSREDGNIRRLVANPEARFAGQNFVYKYRGLCDHYIDIINPLNNAKYLYTDQTDQIRGISYTGDNGYRVILQPFYFGGMVDWGGSKQRLLMHYFHFLRFNVMPNGLPKPILSYPNKTQWWSVYPNPFNNKVVICRAGNLAKSQLKIVDLSGRLIQSLYLAEGATHLIWHPFNMTSGVYFIIPEGPINVQPIKIEYIR